MRRHIFDQKKEFPDTFNMVVEIPKTRAMRIKHEVDLSTGRVDSSQKINDQLPIYWDYGAIPQTVSDDGEPTDVLLLTNGDERRSVSDQVVVKPIAIYNISDGWEVTDHKIVAVPDTAEYANVNSMEQLYAHAGKKGSNVQELIDHFFTRYRADEQQVVKGGWGDQQAAKAYLTETHARYEKTPKSRAGENNTFDVSNRVFIPSPPKQSYPSEYLGDVILDSEMRHTLPHAEGYGPLVGRSEIRALIKERGINRSRTQLAGVDREALILEKLAMAKTLNSAGARTYTISDDKEWVDRAKEAGIATTFVEHDTSGIENMEGLSGQSWEFLHYKHDGENIVIAPDGHTDSALRRRLSALGLMERDEKMTVLRAPNDLIPYGVPNTRGENVSQLTNALDCGFGILPDQNKRPHLFISESVRIVAAATGKAEALAKFETQCRKYFDDVTYITCHNPYGAPTNFIDTGMAVIVPACITDEGKQLIEEKLGREVLRVKCAEHVNIGTPGPRCTTFPVSEITHNFLRSQHILQATGATHVEELTDPDSVAFLRLLEHAGRLRAPPHQVAHSASL